MQTIQIVIEKSADSYGAYAENVPGIYGAGNTVKECKESILDAIKTVKTFDSDQIPEALKGEYTIAYKYDTERLLKYYKWILSNLAIECIAEIRN